MPDLSYIVGQRDWTVPMPKLILDPDEQAVRNIAGLTVWLEPGLDNIERDTEGLFKAWVDRVAQRRFIPRVTAKPNIVARGQAHALQMGFGGALTVTSNGSLRAEDNASLMSADGYTVAFLGRFPVATANGGTEMPNGYTAYGSWLGTALTTTPATYWVFGSNNLASTSVRNNINLGSEITYGPRYDDGLWHYHVVSYDFATKNMVYRKDGVQIAINAAVVREMVSTPAEAIQLVIGGSGAANNLVGEVGAAMVVQHRGLHITANSADLAAMETRLNTMRTALAA
jgi:hypothetical protein